MKSTMGIVLVFALGYVASDIVRFLGIDAAPAYADVAGMDSYDLSRDRDFQKAVIRVIESRCEVYVEGGYGEITC